MSESAAAGLSKAPPLQGAYRPRVAIAMRSCNDIAVIRGTLEAIERQTCRDFVLWSFDSSSSDGTLDSIREFNAPERIELKQSYKRQFGEGKAEAGIFREGKLDTSFLRCTVLPAGMDVLRDLAWAAREGSVDALVHSVPLRLTQKWGRWKGLQEGKRTYGRG